MRILAIIAVVAFLSIALYGAIAPHGLMQHEGGCLSALAFGTACLTDSLVDHLKLFNTLGLILPILTLFLFFAFVGRETLAPKPVLLRASSLVRLPPSRLDKLIQWLSLREHSPTSR